MSNTPARTEREKIRREKLAAFFFDLAKLTFGGIVIGGIINAKLEDTTSILYSISLMVFGLITSIVLSTIANQILKQ